MSAIQGLKSMEGQSGLSELSVISWVSVKRGSTVTLSVNVIGLGV